MAQHSRALPTTPRVHLAHSCHRQPSTIRAECFQHKRRACRQPVLRGVQNLQDGVSGAPLAGQSITLEVEQLWSGKYVNVVTTTGANGTYTVNLSESAQGVYGLYPTFAGNPSYSPSTGYLEVTVGNPMPTTLSLNIPNSNPAVSQSFTMSGYLTDTNGTPISGRQITVDVRLPQEAWTPGPGATTDSNGHYSIATSEQAAGHVQV